MPTIVIAFGLFAGGMFVYRKMTAGEPFSWEKFLPTMGIGALASVVLYLAAGALPGLDQIFTQIETMMPGGAPSVTVIISALLVVLNTVMKGTTAVATTPTPPTSIPAPVTVSAPTVVPGASSGWQPDFSVTPTNQRIQSGTIAVFNLDTGAGDQGVHRCKQVNIDWMDGSPIQEVPIAKGYAQVTHTYSYVAGTSHYDAHAFFPEFTVVDSFDGAKKSFNTDGRACTVECVSLIPA